MAQGIRTTDRVRERIVQRVQEGMTQMDVARMFGVHRDTVRVILRERGIYTGQKQRTVRWQDEDADDALAV